MELDIKRWAGLSATGEYSLYPGERVVLGRQPAHNQPRSKLHGTHVPKQRNLRGGFRPPLHEARDTMARILDTFSASQQKDVKSISTGYLNPDVSNRRMKGEMETKIQQQDVSPVRSWLRTRDSPEATTTAAEDAKETQPNQQHAAKATPPELQPTSHTVVHNTTDLHDILEQFDAVKLQEKFPADESPAAAEPATPILPSLPSTVQQRFLPNPLLNMTKRDEWRTRQEIDGMLDRTTWMSAPKRFAKADQLEKVYAFLDRELAALNAPESGPDFRRLQVYAAVWEKVITQFRLYGPLLAEIKNEYDKTIANFHNDQRELNFLRTKVQSLLSQNENRLLIKYERRKTKALEAKYAALEAENEELKGELRRKLAMYAAYLPPSVLEQRKKEDPALESLEVKSYKPGEDPISVFESQIENLTATTEAQEVELTALRKSITEDCVPRVEKETAEASLATAQLTVEELKAQTAALQTQVEAQRAELETATASLKEKQAQYDFLYREYNELSEAVARKFDPDAEKKVSPFLKHWI
ncbi:Translin-associated factor X-interacting protein 1 [Geranomyces michiganensis]|nr:Translin-associated factor X-interacting protein 1 [Geranomyces michiganensis]